MKSEEVGGLRLYSIGNMYLSGIHAGIQCAHTVGVMADKYLDSNCRFKINPEEDYRQWASQDQTIMCMNGGYAEALEGWVDFLEDGDNKFAWGYFHESREALNGALTNVSIIVPERIYNIAHYATYLSPSEYHHQYTEFERDLGEKLSCLKFM